MALAANRSPAAAGGVRSSALERRSRCDRPSLPCSWCPTLESVSPLSSSSGRQGGRSRAARAARLERDRGGPHAAGRARADFLPGRGRLANVGNTSLSHPDTREPFSAFPHPHPLTRIGRRLYSSQPIPRMFLLIGGER